MANEKFDARKRLAIKYITEYPEIIPLLKDRYLTDDILEECIRLEPDVFKYIKDPSNRLISAAFEIDGGNARYVPKNKILCLPEDTIMSAIESNYEGAMSYIDFKYLSVEAQLDIFMKDPVRALEYGMEVPECYIMTEIRKTPNIIRYIPNATEEMKCEALRLEPNVALYFGTLSEEMMDIIDEQYPYLINVLPNYTRKHENLEEQKNGTSHETESEA